MLRELAGLCFAIYGIRELQQNYQKTEVECLKS